MLRVRVCVVKAEAAGGIESLIYPCNQSNYKSRYRNGDDRPWSEVVYILPDSSWRLCSGTHRLCAFVLA